ncbi:uncharacterized protein LOC124656967 [Lolium rigidum]|uniref:uncharacterized protein LOC124656967 n=1 Tax=Lolium rigidum TaxID=89674 RepID=UPI001F5D0FB4|nr:uncharacterized protein LOC124656967 [Lolium rigidum]
MAHPESSPPVRNRSLRLTSPLLPSSPAKEVKGHPIAAAESSPRAQSGETDERPAAKEAAANGDPPSKEAGDGTAVARPPLSKEAVAGGELGAEGEGLRKPEAEGEGVKKPTAAELKKAETGGEHKKPTGDEPKIPRADEPGTSGNEPENPRAGEAGTSGAESSMPVRAWVTGLGAAGERLYGLSTSISGYQASVAHLSEFLQRVATYAPDSATAGPGPAVLTSIARVCGNIGGLLGDTAAAIQGANSIGLLLGGALQQVARLYGLEVVEEPKPEGKPEAASSPTKTKIIVSTVEQAVKVIKWIGNDSEAEVDVDLDVTPFMAVKIYEEFRSHGPQVLSLISGGATLKAKRAAFYEKND